jgi:LPXTG-motif cell wall-anchored protein
VIPAEGDPDEGTTIRAKRLAQTGDETTLTTLVVFGCALAGAVVVFAALRARRRGAVL